jgi:hypothetical protein
MIPMIQDVPGQTLTRIAVVLLGFVIYGAYFLILRGRVEP